MLKRKAEPVVQLLIDSGADTEALSRRPRLFALNPNIRGNHVKRRPFSVDLCRLKHLHRRELAECVQKLYSTRCFNLVKKHDHSPAGLETLNRKYQLMLLPYSRGKMP